MKIAIIGRQPHISIAELAAVSGGAKIEQLNRQAVLVDSDNLDVAKLGGTIKLAEPVVDRESVDDCLKFIANYYQSDKPSSKINLGFSYYGASAPADFGRKLLSLKKELKASGLSVRIVNQPRDKELNSAQVLYNKLMTDKGQEWLIVKKHSLFVVAKTTGVQDVDDFAARDQARPMRDAKIGMLPPKLALTLVNLATAGKTGQTVLDPFCGSGVVLQEALIQGHDALGSDINPAMVKASKVNLDWLVDDRQIKQKFNVDTGDATNHQWSKFDAVAGETYLGPPLLKFADSLFLQKNVPQIDSLHEKFLLNVHKQCSPGTRLALALPAWARPGNRFERLPLVDRLDKLGYNHQDFEISGRNLIYHREGQYVARDIVVIERK